MSTPAAKRAPPAGRDSPGSTPARTPRASTPSSDRAGAATPTNSLARARSVRSSTPVSARAAAAQRRESHLSNSTTAKSAAAIEAEEAARAETLALLDDLKTRLSKAEGEAEQFHRQNDMLQARLDESHQEHARLEERTHEYDEQAEALKNEKREMARQIQQMETIYEAERSAMTREKEDMANREEEMQTVIQRLKDSLSQRADEEGRPSRQSNNNSPSLDGSSFAPPASLHRSDSRNNSKLLLQKDKLIESLRLELAEAQIKLVESENQGGGRLREVERQLMEARMANARLMEDNESYQLLLQEKTLKGEFSTENLAYPLGGGYYATIVDAPGERPLSSNQDALNALEGKSDAGGAGGVSSSLADELSEATGHEASDVVVVDGSVDSQRRLESEIKSLRDQNKAQQLYINRIIERLLEHQEYQYILDKSTDGKQPLPPQPPSANTNKDLPPPPSAPQNQQQQPGAIQSFLQRTKSMAVGGTSANRQRPRPMSLMPESALNHPETAPSIPIALGRSSSVRRARPVSEQYTGAGGSVVGGGPAAASVVNAMYKGPDRPLSPTLRGSQHFFAPANNRVSTDQVRSPGAIGSSGNFPGMKSETSSVSGDSVVVNGTTGTTTDPSSSPSPPRRQSMQLQHEKTAFTGSKPRPLRLVQENKDNAKTENKRASWMGWAFGKKEDHAAALASHGQINE